MKISIELLDGRTISARPPITISGSGDFELCRSCIKLHCDEDLTTLQGRRFEFCGRISEPPEMIFSEDKAADNTMEEVHRNDQGEWELHFVRVQSEEVRRMAADVYKGDGSPLDGEWN